MCKKCFEEDPEFIGLFEKFCISSSKHFREPQVLVSWSGTAKRLVEVKVPPIRPLPQRTISGSQFILCDGVHCKGETCSYAHNLEEKAEWNNQRKRANSLKSFLAKTETGSHGVLDVRRTSSAKSQGDCSSLSYRDLAFCDEFSESDCTSDSFVASQEEDKKTDNSVLTKETYKQYHQELLKKNKRNHNNLLKRYNGYYNLILLKEAPKCIPKPKPTHVLYAYITGLTGLQILFITHDSQPGSVCASIEVPSHRVCKADVIRHIGVGEGHELHLIVAMDKGNSEKLQQATSTDAPDKTNLTNKDVLQVSVQFSIKSWYWQQSDDLISNETIERIMPEAVRFVPFQRQSLTEVDKKTLKLRQCSDDQAEALKKIVALPTGSPPLLITGAFGTGKTHILILAANYLLQVPGRSEEAMVLVCCQSPASADCFHDQYSSTHILDQTSISITRLSSFENSKLKYCTIRNFISSLGKARTTKTLIICTFQDSLFLARELKKQQQALSFTHILMDEGSQAREAESIAPLCMANVNTRIVIAGDCQQLGPASMLSTDGHRSLFERLLHLYRNVGTVADDYICHLKSTEKYSCHPNIIRFCDELFYDLNVTTKFASPGAFPLSFVCTSVQQNFEASDTTLYSNGNLILQQISQLHETWPADWGTKDLAQSCFVTSNKIEFGNLHGQIQCMNSRELKKIKLLTTSNVQGRKFRAVLVSTSEPTETDGIPLCESRSIWNPYVFNTILSQAQSRVVTLGNPFHLVKMGLYMVTKYGESGHCWNHYLRVCLQHGTLTFDPLLKLQTEEEQQCIEKLKDHLKRAVGDETTNCSEIWSISAEDPTLNQVAVVTPAEKDPGVGKEEEEEAEEEEDSMSNQVSLQVGRTEEEHVERYTVSRLDQDYEEIRELGRGGYGVVYSAKHKVDCQVYAIKVIKLPSHPKHQKDVSKEAEFLSQLSHKNIVRYFNSWNEEAPTGRTGSMWWDALQQLSSQSYSYTDNSAYGESSSEGPQEQSLSSNTHSDSGNGSAVEHLPQEEEQHQSGTSDTSVIFDRSEPVDQQPARRLTALFIQTELCTKTLNKWLEDTTDNNRKRKDVVDFFEQMLEAVKYIHDKKLIHRDLKPANIFLADKILKVGDFGLVTGAELQTQDPGNRQGDHSHSIGVGTKLYMSPEMRTSKYNEKVDIYALGLIFFEMNCPTGSYQERNEIFSTLKQRKKFPEVLEKQYPRECTIISQMIQDHPVDRPSAVGITTGKDFKRLKKVCRGTDTCIKRL